MVSANDQKLKAAMAASNPVFAFAGRRIAVDAPHLAFATAIAAWSVWYCRDAWLAQDNVVNLIFIVPGTIAAVLVYVLVAAGCFRVVGPSGEAPPERQPLAPGMGFKIAGTMVLLAIFVFAAPEIGYDVASFLYVLAMLLFLGERRKLVLLLVPLVFCALAIYCFNTVLATPLPLLLIPSDS
jgi:Tripartite tricarboxylate transporter TctB family